MAKSHSKQKIFSNGKGKEGMGKDVWLRESAFSSIKRMFGEQGVSSTGFQNTVKEMRMRVPLYNVFRGMI